MARGTWLWGASLICSLAFVGCRQGSGERACTPGAVQHCACLGEPDGVQRCADDGSRWGSCECLSAATLGTTDAQTLGVAPDAGSAGEVPVTEAPDAGNGAPADAGFADGIGAGQAQPRTASERQLAEIQARVENTLSLENVLGGGSAAPDMGLAEFAGSGGAVTGLQQALAGAAPPNTAAGATSAGTTEVQAGTGTAQPPPVVEVTPVEPPAAPAPPRGVVRSHGGIPAGGSGQMSGNVFESTTLLRRLGAVQTCYDNALAANATLVGDLIFLVTINQRGKVAVSVEQNDAALDAAGVTACALTELRSTNLSSCPPEGGDVRIRLPISFALAE
jgi:hypothetical protein